ncbi:hypothetical protein Trydic_g4451 [Trypoxylus dichotomus]
MIIEEYQHSSTETNSTSEELSLESHEAMTKGGEFKPKFTTGTTTRQKRSYEFLLGLVNNNSKFQVTNTEDDIRIPRRDKVFSGDLGAGELLLEMMVKIAAHPDQWEQVHSLLQKIDNDLMTSKKIISEMDTTSSEKSVTENNVESNKGIEINKKFSSDKEGKHSINKEMARQNKTKLNNTEVAQAELVELNDSYHKPKNISQKALKTNQWTYGIVTNVVPDSSVDQREDSFSRYQAQTKPMKSSFPRNFAYHRVTGNPLYHNNINNNPKAYIAVSVIAPKPINDRPTDEDLVLENELRELKPWTHNQNLKNMASIRSRWVIQSDKEKAAYTP